MENLLIAEHTTSPYLITPSFSGHQTFAFRYTWLKKGVDAVMDNPTVFSADNASVVLGVGKNMVSSIRHWCIVAGLIRIDPYERGRLLATPLGKAIFSEDGFDPYLDDPATLWLIHWKIATNINQATAWYWAFNICTENQFIRTKFITDLYTWTQYEYTRTNGKPRKMKSFSDNTLQRDVNCLIRTYCQARYQEKVVEESFDCPLGELNLISELPEDGHYEFQRGKKETLPSEIIAATLVALWDARFPDRETLPFSDIMRAPLSPGRIFRIDEETMVHHLEELENLSNGGLRYDETANLKQVYRQKDINQIEFLRKYYE